METKSKQHISYLAKIIKNLTSFLYRKVNISFPTKKTPKDPSENFEKINFSSLKWMGKNLYVKLCVYGIEKCLCRKSKRIIKDTNTYTDLMDYFFLEILKRV